MGNIAVMVGVASVGLLWAFSLVGAAAVVWETFAEQVHVLIDRIKG